MSNNAIYVIITRGSFPPKNLMRQINTFIYRYTVYTHSGCPYLPEIFANLCIEEIQLEHWYQLCKAAHCTSTVPPDTLWDMIIWTALKMILFFKNLGRSSGLLSFVSLPHFLYIYHNYVFLKTNIWNTWITIGDRSDSCLLDIQ